MGSRVIFLVCWFIVAISGYDSFDDGYNNDIMGLSNSVSGANLRLLPLVHKNINVINNAGNLTISDLKKTLNDVSITHVKLDMQKNKTPSVIIATISQFMSLSYTHIIS
ncbi:uncharacterized protein [Choristoneura fumiferana]|uniref:uncharacterized protein n=1 Tax=Choristoneura fumiferana TaxID=7141 RepID=UPI003D15B96A